MFLLHCWLCYYRFSCYVSLVFVFCISSFFFFFSVLAKRLARKSIPKMTCFLLSGSLSIYSINQSSVIPWWQICLMIHITFVTVKCVLFLSWCLISFTWHCRVSLSAYMIRGDLCFVCARCIVVRLTAAYCIELSRNCVE